MTAGPSGSPWDADPRDPLFPAAGEEHGPVGPDELQALVAYAAQMRQTLDAIAQARPPVEVWNEATERARGLAALFAPYAVPENSRIVGQVRQEPGRGQTFAPPIHVLHRDADRVEAEVVLDQTHLGANGAAHGGVLPLVFDELMGRQANFGRTKARTAYMHVDFRKITPIGVPIRLEALVDREEGRKRYLRGTARVGRDVVVEGEGLFVELRPGQP
jgi:acyl-coenzyme A thioesterase PaaI-like protein